MARRKRVRRARKSTRRVRRVKHVRVRRTRRVKHVRVRRSRRHPGMKRIRRKVYALSRSRNPFAIMGRKGQFGLIPDMNTIKDGAVAGIGAAVSDVVRATGYSLIGRVPNQSIAEDFVARLVSGWVTGGIAGYTLGGALANKVYEGNLTVAIYELVADAAAVATQGAPKLFGFVANPYAGRPVKSFLPSFSFGGAPALSAGGMSGLGEVVPEGQIVPVGSVIPEGDILPLGEDVPRFRSRF